MKSYFECYAKRPSGDAARLTRLVSEERWRLLGDAGCVLDIGFGQGDFIDAAPAGVTVHGVDADPVAVERRPDVGVLGSGEDLPFGNEMFDAIHAAHVIEHLDHPQGMIEECARVLRPHGRLLVVTPDIERYRFKFWVDHTHKTPFTVESLSRLLLMYGFEEVSVTRGLFRQTRVEELAARLGMRVEDRYRVRRCLGRRLGAELVALATCTDR